jgi:hypothetical protein
MLGCELQAQGAHAGGHHPDARPGAQDLLHEPDVRDGVLDVEQATLAVVRPLCDELAVVPIRGGDRGGLAPP